MRLGLDSLRGMAGELVHKICVSCNSSSSDYDSDDEMSSRSSEVPEVVPHSSGCSTNETTRSEAVEDGISKNSTTCRSFLTVLKRPTTSDLCRKRTIRQNPPKGKKRKTSSSSCSTDPKSVTPAQRCLEFRDEPFTVSAGKLLCSCCREELSLK